MPRFWPPTLVLPLILAACTDEPQVSTDGLAFEGSGDVIEGEFIISADLTSLELEQLGIEQLGWNDVLEAGLYYAPDGASVSGLARALQASRGGSVELNRPMSAFAVNDPYYRYQWDMAQLDVQSAWSTYNTGSGVRVAVIDSGVSSRGEDRPKYMVAGYDFVMDDSDPTDENGHGTHVAGTISQATNNAKGSVGVAPDAEIMALRVLDAEGYGDSYATAEAIVWAVDHGADVINMSLGSAYTTTVEKKALDYAAAKGIVVVAASGNEYATSVSYPAAHPSVIAVGASRFDGTAAAYSNGGSALDILAPGGDLGVDQNKDGYGDGILQETLDGYEFFEGTSMASPHVAGIAALLISEGALPGEVAGLLTSTAKDVGASGWDSRSGAGLVQLGAALAKVGSAAEVEEEPEDLSGPVISGVGGTRSGTSLTLRWKTDEPATSQIRFEGYSATYGDEALVTTHELRFTINSGSTYKFTVVSEDAAGNVSTDGVWTSKP